MPLMDGLRRLFQISRSESRPVEIDLTGDSAVSSAGVDRGENGEPSHAAEAVTNDSLATVHRRKPSLSEVQRGYDEVMGLVRKIGDHLDAQNRRTERLVELMERLPEALDALPEMHRQNARLLDVLGEHLDFSRRREESLNATLGRISESSTHQTEVLGLLQQQFDSSTRSAEQMTQTLGSFSEALSGLSANNHRSVEVLSGLARSAEHRESRLVEMVGRSQKWTIGIMIGVGVLAVAAITLGAIALLR